MLVANMLVANLLVACLRGEFLFILFLRPMAKAAGKYYLRVGIILVKVAGQTPRFLQTGDGGPRRCS
jgi:hypothetical protein